MPLSDSELDRYARQVIIPGLGAAGQERLLAAAVHVVGSCDAARAAREYLTRSGVRVVSGADAAGTACVIAPEAHTQEAADALRALSFAPSTPLYWSGATENGYRRGTTTLGAFLREPYPAGRDHPAADPVTGAYASIAALDLAGSAIALVLGWPGEHDGQGSEEVSLG